MTPHQLHDKARALALRQGITHGAACSILAKRRRKARKPAKLPVNNTQKQPAAYWWQNLDQ